MGTRTLMTSVEHLKSLLQELSQGPKNMQQLAAECEQIYKDQGEIRKLIHDKKNERILEKERAYLDQVKTFSKNTKAIMDNLNSIWKSQQEALTKSQDSLNQLSEVEFVNQEI